MNKRHRDEWREEREWQDAEYADALRKTRPKIVTEEELETQRAMQESLRLWQLSIPPKVPNPNLAIKFRLPSGKMSQIHHYHQLDHLDTISNEVSQLYHLQNVSLWCNCKRLFGTLQSNHISTRTVLIVSTMEPE